MRSGEFGPLGLWREMARLQGELERLFGRYEGELPARGQNEFPPLNLWQDEENLFIEMELPGLALPDLEIVVTGENQLSIKGERKQPQVAAGTWHRQECTYGSFARVVQLPQGVEGDRVAAELKNGVLTIRLPKRAEARRRRIEVKAG